MTRKLGPGDSVGGYEIVGKLGVGASGAVYRVRRAGAAQQMALKLMHKEHLESETEKRRFVREAEVVKKLAHPNIVPLLDYGDTDDGTPYLVFALLTGQPLDERLKGGALSNELTGRFAIHVLRALERAHGLEIVHRDIKPANIFLSRGVMGDIAQVLDFGLAKLVTGPTDHSVTGTSVLVGTPRYMAPEQVRGEQVGQAADIYSFGLVMAEMLLGRPVIAGESEVEVYIAQGSDMPVHLPDKVLQSPFGAIIQRAADKRVKVRYQLASQMLADVRAVVERLSQGEQGFRDEAELEATKMIDIAALQGGINEQAEKMRAALNQAAFKAAEKRAAADPSAPVVHVIADEISEEDMVEDGFGLTAVMSPEVAADVARRERRGTDEIDVVGSIAAAIAEHGSPIADEPSDGGGTDEMAIDSQEVARAEARHGSPVGESLTLPRAISGETSEELLQSGDVPAPRAPQPSDVDALLRSGEVPAASAPANQAAPLQSGEVAAPAEPTSARKAGSPTWMVVALIVVIGLIGVAGFMILRLLAVI